MISPQIDFIIDHIIDQMAYFMTQDYRLSVPETLNFIYNSETYRLLLDKSNGLYVQSPSYIYELLKKEYLTGSIR